MHGKQKAPIMLAAVFFILGAIAEIATGRSRTPQDDAAERMRRSALVTVDEALAEGDAAAALQAWQRAYDAARTHRGWQALVEAADAAARIEAEVPGTAASRARRVYLMALDRARAERSTEGAVRVAEGFSRLRDREVTEHVLRIAATIARGSGDVAAPTRVETARARLLERPRA